MTQINCFVAKNKMKKNCSYMKVNFCSLLNVYTFTLIFMLQIVVPCEVLGDEMEEWLTPELLICMPGLKPYHHVVSCNRLASQLGGRGVAFFDALCC